MQCVLLSRQLADVGGKKKEKKIWTVINAMLNERTPL